MPDSNIIQIDQNLFETKLDRLVTEKMTQILNAMLDAEADEITGAARYERKEGRKAYRAGHYERTLTAKAGRLELRVPKLKGAVFESAVIERYRRRESSVEEALMEMCLAGVSVYGQINVYSVTTKSERYERSYWTRTAAGNGIGGRKAPVPYGS